MLSFFRQASPVLRDAHDVLAFAVHGVFVQAGFVCVSVSDSEVKGEGGGGICPQHWNAELETYCFQYKHPRSSSNLILKMVRLEDMLLVHGLTLADQALRSAELYVYDYVRRDFKRDDFSSLLMHEDRLKALLHRQLIDKILPPEVEKPSPVEDQRDYRDPLRVPSRGPFVEPPRGPSWNPDPTMPFGPRGGDFGSDIGPGFGMPGSLPGNLMGPGHFGARGPGLVARPRFDPFGPPGAPGEPEPDHLRMPGPQPRRDLRRPDFDRDII